MSLQATKSLQRVAVRDMSLIKTQAASEMSARPIFFKIHYSYHRCYSYYHCYYYYFCGANRSMRKNC